MINYIITLKEKIRIISGVDLMLGSRFAQIPRQEGTKKISIVIEPSFEKSICFDFYQNALSWTVYWAFEPSAGECRSTGPVFSHEIDTETAKSLKWISDNGLSKPAEKELGLDGHSYHISIDGFPEEYSCWCVIPKEWACLKDIIAQCVEYAGLDQDHYGCMISR